MYGDCLINVPCSSFLLDCVINVNDSKIDIEYDGSYWHQDIRKDLIRDKIVQKNGYKVLRIKSKNKIPNQEQIQKAIQFLLQPESYFTQIILDDYKNK
jgi:very-short-patch-repair endonuclease